MEEEDILNYKMQTWNYNPDGRCGAVAASLVLHYYYYHNSYKYIKSSHLTFNGIKLIEFLTDYIPISSNYSKITNGLSKYLSDRGVTKKAVSICKKNSLVVYNKIKSYIKSDLALIVGLTNHPTYGEHWVAGMGYSKLYSKYLGYVYVIIVDDGWGNTNVRINLMYTDGCVYITNK